MSRFTRLLPRALKRPVRRALLRVGWYAQPNFLVIGAAKAGTTALHTYLGGHPDAVSSFEKEIFYFSPESMREWTAHPEHAWYAQLERIDHDPSLTQRALDWYHLQFPARRPGRRKHYFESTPCYLYYPGSARRIRAYRPDMKLIVSLRDPVERAFSQWNAFRQLREPPYDQLRDDRSFEDAVLEEMLRLPAPADAGGSDYVRRGLYFGQLQPYFELFPKDQILILDCRDLQTRCRETMDRVTDFLGMARFAPEVTWPPMNVGNYERAMSPFIREVLANFYRPHNEALFELLGRQFDWATPQSKSDVDLQEVIESVRLKKAR